MKRALPILSFALLLALASGSAMCGGYPPTTKHSPPTAFVSVPLAAPAALRRTQEGAEAILRDVSASQWRAADKAVSAVTGDEHDLEMALTDTGHVARTVTALRRAVFALVSADGVRSAPQTEQAARRVLACCATLEHPFVADGAAAVTVTSDSVQAPSLASH